METKWIFSWLNCDSHLRLCFIMQTLNDSKRLSKPSSFHELSNTSCASVRSNEKNPGCLEVVWGVVLPYPLFLGSILSRYRNPYQTTSIMEQPCAQIRFLPGLGISTAPPTHATGQDHQGVVKNGEGLFWVLTMCFSDSWINWMHLLSGLLQV